MSAVTSRSRRLKFLAIVRAGLIVPGTRAFHMSAAFSDTKDVILWSRLRGDVLTRVSVYQSHASIDRFGRHEDRLTSVKVKLGAAICLWNSAIRSKGRKLLVRIQNSQQEKPRYQDLRATS